MKRLGVLLGALLLGWAALAEAALTFDAATSAGDNNNVSSVSFSHVAGANARVLVALPAANDGGTGNRDITDVTWAGASITFLRQDDQSVDRLRTECWYRLSPTTGTQTVVFTAAGTVPRLSGGVITLNDDVGEPTINANNGANGLSTAPSVSITTTEDNAWLVGVLQTNTSDPANVSVTTGTERWETDIVNQTVSGATNGPVSPAGSYSLTWSTGNNRFAISAVAVAPAAAGAAPPQRTLLGVGV